MADYSFLDNLLPIIYEDDRLLAIAKPPGLDCPQTSERAERGFIHFLAAHRGRGESFFVCNRISGRESGVLLLAKDAAFAKHIGTGIKTGSVETDYVAVVTGRLKAPRVSIGAEHGRSRGRDDRPKRRTSATPRRTDETGVTVVERIRAEGKRSLIRCRTRVRSAHVLAAQLRSAGLSILGDRSAGAHRSAKASATVCLHVARIAFHHPDLKRKITITAPPPAEFARIIEGERSVDRPLTSGLARRFACLGVDDTNAFRLFTGYAEGIKGVTAERYGDVLILVLHEGHGVGESLLLQMARWYRKSLGIKSAVAKYVPRSRESAASADRSNVDQPDGQTPPRVILGTGVPERIEILEAGLRFQIRPFETSVGLFLDQRDNRRRIRELAQGKTVLNLFAHTCGFSVAAAVGGATRTVSVDISQGLLDWGRENFALNGVSTADHEFIRCEAVEFCKRAKRLGHSFDVIVLDPPTFAHGRKRGRFFSVDRDLGPLVATAAHLLNRDGIMMVSVNRRGLSANWLRDQVKKAVRGRRVRILATPPLPDDFAVDPGHAKSILVRFP